MFNFQSCVIKIILLHEILHKVLCKCRSNIISGQQLLQLFTVLNLPKEIFKIVLMIMVNDRYLVTWYTSRMLACMHLNIFKHWARILQHVIIKQVLKFSEDPRSGLLITHTHTHTERERESERDRLTKTSRP